MGLQGTRWFILGKADGDRLTPGEEPGGTSRFSIDADQLIGD
jgi:hypothetical protein